MIWGLNDLGDFIRGYIWMIWIYLVVFRIWLKNLKTKPTLVAHKPENNNSIFRQTPGTL